VRVRVRLRLRLWLRVRLRGSLQRGVEALERTLGAASARAAVVAREVVELGTQLREVAVLLLELPLHLPDGLLERGARTHLVRVRVRVRVRVGVGLRLRVSQP